MYPHERSLVQRLKDKFTILGINSDQKDHLAAAIKREKLNWPIILDGEGTDGPIATTWNVRSWPTMYLIDAKGTIRYAALDPADLDSAIDRLVQEQARQKPANESSSARPL